VNAIYSANLPNKFESSSAWKGADLVRQPTRWTRVLNSEEIAEIDLATVQFNKSGIAIEEISPENFPLPQIGPHLKTNQGTTC